MNFNTFALLALLAPVAVQSHATEIRHCITSDTDPKLRIFVAHWHGRTNYPALYPNSNPSNAGTLTFTKNNESPISLFPNSLIFDVSGNNIWQQGCQGNSTTVASTCSTYWDDWVVFDFPLTIGVPVTYKMEYGNETGLVLLDGCYGGLYPVKITASLTLAPSPSPSRSASPSAKPSAKPSASASPSTNPSESPSAKPSAKPSASPSYIPSDSPSDIPSDSPSAKPSAKPSDIPSDSPSDTPSDIPSDQPSLVPSRSSKKGKKKWRAERLARDPNFPTFAPKSAKDKSSKSTKVPASILKSSIYTDGEE